MILMQSSEVAKGAENNQSARERVQDLGQSESYHIDQKNHDKWSSNQFYILEEYPSRGNIVYEKKKSALVETIKVP